MAETRGTYATIDDVIALFETKPDATRQNRLASALATATDEINEQMGGRDYFRHPSTGSETWYADGNGTNVLHVHAGLVALDTLEVSQDGGVTYTTLDPSTYALRGTSPSLSDPIPDGEPFFHVVLNPSTAAESGFPAEFLSTRLTGARGWDAPPRPLTESCAARARQLAYGDQSYSGQMPGPSEYNAVEYVQATVGIQWPHVLWAFMRREKARFIGCGI